VGKSFDSSFIVRSFRRALSERLVVEGTIIIIIPLVVSFMFNALSLLAPIFNLVVCISVANDVTQVMVILVSSSAVFLWGSEAAGRVSAQSLAVVRVLILHSISVIWNLRRVLLGGT
jgi:hypothetical protein